MAIVAQVSGAAYGLLFIRAARKETYGIRIGPCNSLSHLRGLRRSCDDAIVRWQWSDGDEVMAWQCDSATIRWFDNEMVRYRWHDGLSCHHHYFISALLSSQSYYRQHIIATSLNRLFINIPVHSQQYGIQIGPCISLSLPLCDTARSIKQW